jgi:two-component system sensor histidine kinase VanS
MAEQRAARASGPSVRLKLALSYAAVLMVAGVGLLAVVWLWLLRYVPDGFRVPPGRQQPIIIGPDRSDLLAAFVPKAAWMLAFLLAFALVGGWVLAGRMLAPLHRITEATRQVGNGSFSHRIHLPGRRDEFRELGDAFDSMLGRLEAHVAEQQRFAANASHELRTPLAITKTLLDVASGDPHLDGHQLVDRLRVVNDRAIELTEALLLLSRADQRSFTRVAVDLSLVAEEAAETLLPVATAHGATIEVSGDPALTIGSQTLLLHLVTNLVQNAIVHNLPEDGRVWIVTTASEETVTLAVDNTGEPLSPQVVSTLAEPFARGAGRTRTEHSGLGLGLAIVDRITHAHDGHLTILARPGGGLRVRVDLPAAPRSPGAA